MRLNTDDKYENAINAYSVAMFHCMDRSDEARKKILEAFAEISQLKRDADKALAQMQAANANVVRLLLGNAQREVLNLRYEEALKIIKAVAQLNALKEEVAADYFEILFWHSETGDISRASQLLDAVATYTQDKGLAAATQRIPGDTIAARNHFRKAMKAYSPTAFDSLMIRYYPEMLPIKRGTFLMGCDSKIDKNCQRNETLHEAGVSDFKMARTETTVWQFALYCKTVGKDIGKFTKSIWIDPGNNPVIYVRWYDAIEYANWVSTQLELKPVYTILKDSIYQDTNYLFELNGLKWTVDWSASGFRLPTEAEWEYAAKGGAYKQKYVYSGSDSLELVGWYRDNADRTNAVGLKQANELGLYDMSGNVWEWCWDWYGAYPETSLETDKKMDYRGPEKGRTRVLRGGSWINVIYYCRSSIRNDSDSYNRYYNFGFRFVQGF